VNMEKVVESTEGKTKTDEEVAQEVLIPLLL
jgi:hypothetical protein